MEDSEILEGLVELVEDLEALLVVDLVVQETGSMTHLTQQVDLWKKLFLEHPGMTTPYLPRSLKPPSFVTDRRMEVTMLILKLNAKPSTSVPMMAVVA